MDLFERAALDAGEKDQPLAARMRPRSLEDMVGQEAVLGPRSALRRAMEQGRIPSLILYGPPGSGKTSLARLIADSSGAHFAQLNAVTSGVADLRRVIEEARQRAGWEADPRRRRTILFIDEIHRFNKAQQDALLAAVEDGTVVLIGATTENPYFELNAPLLSRAQIVRLEPLSDEAIGVLLERALADEERGLGAEGPWELEEEARRHITGLANGDGRAALNILEATVQGLPPGRRRITLEDVEGAWQRKAVVYDRDGDAHYDTVSAFIKSLRGSDPDAAVYWLARMLEAGEDPRFIARRMIIHASEDVGLADPNALVVAVAAAHALEHVGLPEARLNLAQAALYIALAPKSNSVYRAIDGALRAVRKERWDPVPPHLRDASYRGARQLGHGKGYRYPHDFPGHYVEQQYMPDNMVGRRFYEPSDQGREGMLRQRRRGSRSEGGERPGGER